MNVAAITVTLDDDYKIKEWKQWYEEYKDEISLHIIVDNGSSPEYLNKVKSNFTGSTIIERSFNGASTIAYNDGIRKALENSEIDGILLIGNDVRIEKGGIKKLHEYLYSDDRLGIVSPICLKKDSRIVEDFGAKITKFLTMDAKGSGAGNSVDDIVEKTRLSETVLGGCCLAKPEFYKTVGLQDEKLFMYSDEVDTGIRAKKAGFHLGYTSYAKAWHQHINPPHQSFRSPMASYLINRNKVYIAKKHFGFFRAIAVFCFLSINNIRLLIRNVNNREGKHYYSIGIKGAKEGLHNNMKNDSRLWK